MSKIYITIIILTVLLTGYLAYNRFAYMNIVVKFDNLEPFDRQVNVYYKGFKVGKSVKIYPDKNYLNTYLKLKLAPADVHLPQNITAKLQKNGSTNYINIIPPEEASVKLIKEGDIIKGTASKDINRLISDKLDAGSLDAIIDNTSTLMESTNITVKELGTIFSQINEIISDVKGDIKTASNNFAKTSSNLEDLSSKLNNSLDKESMKNSIDNIEETTKNIKEITNSLNSAGEQIDKVTVPMVNSALCLTNSTIKNADEITNGLKNTLKKRFGLGRLLFGKPVRNECD